MNFLNTNGVNHVRSALWKGRPSAMLVVFAVGSLTGLLTNAMNFGPLSRMPSCCAGEMTATRSSAQIREAFRRTHEGFSSDELLVDDRLRCAFLAEIGIDCDEEGTADAQESALLDLLKLRKTGKLQVKTTRSRREDLTNIADAAEIAVRTVLDRHQVSVDRIICAPGLRSELQAEAARITPGADPRLIRKAVLRLRKTRRLRPELVLRVAQWQTEIKTMSIAGINWAHIPEQPGVYLFRSQDGYLYIGEASNLRDRLSQHWSGSHNEGLAGVLAAEASRLASENSSEGNEAYGNAGISLELHVFSSDSPGRQVTMRRAYESELIRSRLPKFNLKP